MLNVSELDTMRQNETQLTPSESELKEAQLKIIDALARGSTVAAAASAAGVSRATFYRWHNAQPHFVAAIHEAQADYTRLVRERLNRLSQKAISRLDALLDDPKTPHWVTLKTALAILERPASVENHWILPEPAEIVPGNEAPNLQNEANLPNEPNLQNKANPPNEANSPAAASPTPQSPASEVPSQTDSLARNAPCPCRSAFKYKRCCGLKAPLSHRGAQSPA